MKTKITAAAELIKGFRKQVQQWGLNYPGLRQHIQSLCPYPVINPIVFNNDLISLVDLSQVKYILVADNPGELEQVRQRYLIGPAGTMARNALSELVTDYNKEILILNKTPIHTKSTGDLKDMPQAYSGLLKETQEYMASLTYQLHGLLGCSVIIVGLSGCRTPRNGWLKQNIDRSYTSSQVLPYYFAEIRRLYSENSNLSQSLGIFKHFSYGGFGKDLKPYDNTNLPLKKKLQLIGGRYRSELLGA